MSDIFIDWNKIETKIINLFLLTVTESDTETKFIFETKNEIETIISWLETK